MKNEFKEVPVEKFWFAATETNIKFNKPNKNRTYIKVLEKCKDYKTARMLFPNTSHALMHMERDMCRAGLLQRYAKNGSRAYWYKTTDKGLKLLEQVNNI